MLVWLELDLGDHALIAEGRTDIDRLPKQRHCSLRLAMQQLEFTQEECHITVARPSTHRVSVLGGGERLLLGQLALIERNQSSMRPGPRPT